MSDDSGDSTKPEEPKQKPIRKPPLDRRPTPGITADLAWAAKLRVDNRPLQKLFSVVEVNLQDKNFALAEKIIELIERKIMPLPASNRKRSWQQRLGSLKADMELQQKPQQATSKTSARRLRRLEK